VTWPSSHFTHADVDNAIKPLLDYLQRVEVVENHKFCRKFTVGFGDAPLGCLVAMRSWVMDDQFEHPLQRTDGLP